MRILVLSLIIATGSLTASFAASPCDPAVIQPLLGKHVRVVVKADQDEFPVLKIRIGADYSGPQTRVYDGTLERTNATTIILTSQTFTDYYQNRLSIVTGPKANPTASVTIPKSQVIHIERVSYGDLLAN